MPSLDGTTIYNSPSYLFDLSNGTGVNSTSSSTCWLKSEDIGSVGCLDTSCTSYTTNQIYQDLSILSPTSRRLGESATVKHVDERSGVRSLYHSNGGVLTVDDDDKTYKYSATLSAVSNNDCELLAGTYYAVVQANAATNFRMTIKSKGEPSYYCGTDNSAAVGLIVFIIICSICCICAIVAGVLFCFGGAVAAAAAAAAACCCRHDKSRGDGIASPPAQTVQLAPLGQGDQQFLTAQPQVVQAVLVQQRQLPVAQEAKPAYTPTIQGNVVQGTAVPPVVVQGSVVQG